MNSFESIVLGFVQGLTEFLPVSSSGHLVMAGAFLDLTTPGVFVEVALHLATLLAVIIVYRQRLTGLATGLVRRDAEAWRYAGLLLLASVPAGIVGVFMKDAIEQVFGYPAVTGVMLLITGGLLWSTRRIKPENARNELDWRLALGIGLAQAFAILPGISRSGATITAGLWGGLAGDKAAEFSFLMSIVAVSGAVVLQVGEIGESIQQVGAVPLLVGFIVALISGIVAIQSLIWLLRRKNFHAFAFYTWSAGVLFLLYLGFR